MDIIFFLEWAALLTSLILHIAPFLEVSEMMKTKTTKEVPFLVFVITSLCCVQFGTMSYVTGNTPFLFLNICGFFLNSFYFSVYCHVSDKKTSCLVYLLLALNYIILLYYHLIQNYPQTSEFVQELTFYSAILVTIVSLLPLPDVMHSYWSKKATPTSHLLQTLILFNVTCWVVYGHVLDSLYISIPNLIGLVVQVAKSAVIATYAKPIKRKKQ